MNSPDSPGSGIPIPAPVHAAPGTTGLAVRTLRDRPAHGDLPRIGPHVPGATAHKESAARRAVREPGIAPLSTIARRTPAHADRRYPMRRPASPASGHRALALTTTRERRERDR